MPSERYDLVVIGAGPGGYIAAIRAAQLGWKVACVEKAEQLGGTCLRVGCIPSKALLESSELYARARESLGGHGVRIGDVDLDLRAMLERKEKIVGELARGVDGLFRKHGIRRVRGHGRLAAADRVNVEDGGGETSSLAAGRVLIATGSRAASLRGVDIDGERVGTSTEALSYDSVPERLVVIGAGYIGLELGSVWHRLGAEVTVLEALPRILPGMDRELADAALEVFEKQGLRFRLETRVEAVRSSDAGCRVELEGEEPLECDRVLVAVGRLPNTEGLGLDEVGVETDEKGRVVVGDDFRTTADGIYAIGDVIRGPMLAHKAEEEGIAVAEHLVTGHGHVDYDAIPGVVYTHPEIAAVGRTEEDLAGAGIEYRKGVFPFRANARARVLGETQGWVKVLAHAGTDRVLGVHVLGARAGDLIAEAAAAIAFGASSEDIARASHAHPTLAEALKEAALAVDGRQLNL